MSITKRLCAVTLALAMTAHPAVAQDAYAFFRGETFPPPRSEPAAWLMELHKADEFFNSNIAVATFLPNTRLKWHHHPGGQILLITDGVGYYQEKGQPKRLVRTGDVIKCLPGVEHWHGAAVESGVTYVAISPAHKGGTVWAQPVTDDEYAGPASEPRASTATRKAETAGSTKLLEADGTFQFNVASTTLAPGRKVDWHKHPGGQILILTDGSGYYQERGQPQQLQRKGDVVRSAAGVEHWHGAATEIGVTYFTITPGQVPDKEPGAEARAESPVDTPAAREARETAPQLYAYTQGVLFGDLWNRPELSRRDRSLVTMSSLVANGQGAQLTSHVNLALDHGVKPAEIGGLIEHLASLPGGPDTKAALGVARTVFGKRGVEAGNAGLEARDRSLVAVAARIARGSIDELAAELARAKANGLTKVQAAELATHLAFYAGWPRAMSALPAIRVAFEGAGSKS